MKKQLVIVGIVFLLVSIGFSGCTNNFNNDNTPSNNSYQQEKKINKPSFSVNEDYKLTCQPINISDLYSESINYTGKNVTFRGRIESISYDEGYTIYEVSDKDFLSSWSFIYRYIMAATDKYTNLQKNDLIQVWGIVQGNYTPDFSIFYYKYVWSFFIEKLHEKQNLSEDVIQNFYQQLGWRNPTYAEMINFLSTDQTEYLQFNYTYQYADLLIEKARFKGFITGEVSIHSNNDSYTGIGTIAEIVCFNTSDKGLFFVESQTDEVFTQKEIDSMQANGIYGTMQFDHYTINFLSGGGSFGGIEYDWDYTIGAWIFIFNNKTYTIYPTTNN